MHRYIKYEEEFRVAICVSCRIAVPSTFILRHFSEKHKDVWKLHRAELKKHIGGMKLSTMEQVKSVEGSREPIPGLEVTEGWICGEDDCSFCTVSEKYMKAHFRSKHGVGVMETKTWYKGRIQTLFGHPHIKYYTSVNDVNRQVLSSGDARDNNGDVATCFALPIASCRFCSEL